MGLRKKNDADVFDRRKGPNKFESSSRQRLAFDVDHALAEIQREIPTYYGAWIERARRFESQGLLEPHILAQLYFVMPLVPLAQQQGRYKFFKSVFEVSFSWLTLLLGAPFLILIASLIKLDSSGPVFFRQLRMGYMGKPFWIYKFRSMAPNAERANSSIIPLRKNSDDMRVTRIGHFIRKYKIDELPQLLNIVKGEMSLIGPRPLSMDESLIIEKRFSDRFAVKPGMSGLWQAFRPDCNDANLKIRFDAVYARRICFGLDAKIFFTTLKVLLTGENLRNARKLYSLKIK